MLRQIVPLALVLLSGCAITVPLPMDEAGGETGAATTSPRIIVATELADAALEAGKNWTDATTNLDRVFAPAVSVSDEVDPDTAEADWTVTAVDHVDACATESDPDPRGCTIGGPTLVRARRGPFVFEATVIAPRKQILIRRGLNPYEIVSTVMHEYGHAIDLEHLPAGLMNPNRSHSERVDPMVDTDTLAEYEAVTAR